MKKNIFILFIASTIFVISACSKNSSSTPAPDACAGLSFKFAADVEPIIISTCATSSNCHGVRSQNSGGPLTDYNLVYAKRSNIQYQVNGGFMPKGSSLSADQKNKIICWINSGAPNN